MRHVTLLLFCGLLSAGTALRAQERPEREGRLFAALSVGLDVQESYRACAGRPRCAGGGPAIQALVGTRVGRGFSIAVARRAFTVFTYEWPQSSQYWLLTGRYTPPALQHLSLNAGVGHVRNEVERSTAAEQYSEAGAAVTGSVTLRLPAHSRVGLISDLGVIKTVSGARAFRPWTATFSIGLSVGPR